MWSAIGSLLMWCLKNWKQILSWVGLSVVAAWGVFESFDGMKTVATWAFGHWSSVFEYTCRSMDGLADSLSEFQLSVPSWVALIMDMFAIGEFVDSLVGWGAYVVLVVEWVFTGLVVSVIGFAVILIYFKLRLKGMEAFRQ